MEQMGKCCKNETISRIKTGILHKKQLGIKIALYLDRENLVKNLLIIRNMEAEYMLEKIEKVLEEKVRPALLAHEGNVQVISFEDGILKIRLTGQCSGCPSAQLTTEELIAKKVMDEIPEIKDVVLVNEISPELLEFAKKLLSHQAEC